MFFRFEIGARARAASRLIGSIRDDLVKAVVQEKEASGLTQQQLAQKLGVSRATLNRSLAGNRELTLRSVAELAWALDREVSIELRKPDATPGRNYAVATSTATTPTVKARGAASGPTSAGTIRTYFANASGHNDE